MNIFDLRERLVRDYGEFISGFLKIRDPPAERLRSGRAGTGVLWPEPCISLNPNFESGGKVDDLVNDGRLHTECRRVFRIKTEGDPAGRPLRLHRHQAEAIQAAASGDNYVLTTGTGSGKSLSYIVPIVDRILRLNALANSQAGELGKFLSYGYPDGRSPVTFRRYTRPGGRRRAARHRRQPPGHPADQLHDGRADSHPGP